MRGAPVLVAAAVTALLLAAPALANPEASSQGAFRDPASPVAREINTLFVIITVIAFIVGIFVEGLLVYTLLKFRAGHAASEASDGDGKAGEPSAGGKPTPHVLPPHYHNKKLEAGITLFTAVAFAALVVVSWNSLNAIETPSEPVDLYIDVVAHQWAWEFHYPAQGVVESASRSEMHVPMNAVVRLNVTSTDVAHAVWIPDLGVKIDAYPGHMNHFWFKAEKEGRFLLQCAEFCGGAHSEMHAIVVSESPAAFAKWVDFKIAQASPPPPPLGEGGELNITLSDGAINISRPFEVDVGANVTLHISNTGPAAHALALDAPYNSSNYTIAPLNASANITVHWVFDKAVTNGTYSCGAPGACGAGPVARFNVTAAARVIDLHLYDSRSTEGPRTWAIVPAKVVVHPGELIKFRVINNGTMAHNVKVGNPYIGVLSPDVGAGNITFTPAFTVSASTEYWCDVSGHKDLGMKGTLDAGGEFQAPKEIPGFGVVVLFPAVALAAAAAARVRPGKGSD